MHHAARQQSKCLQTFFVDASMQTDVDNQWFGELDAHIMNDLRQMLQSSSIVYSDDGDESTGQRAEEQLLPDHQPNMNIAILFSLF